MTLAIRRSGTWGPGATFAVLGAVFATGAPEAGAKVFYALLTAASVYWFVRSWRVRAELTETSLIVHGQVRTRRIDLVRIREVVVEPMRTASPLAARFPYAAIAVDLVDGKHVQFQELSVSEDERQRLDEFTSSINSRLR